MGILAATQLREISSPRLANAQVDSFKDDNSVAFHQTRARTHIRVEVPKLTKRLPQNLMTNPFEPSQKGFHSEPFVGEAFWLPCSRTMPQPTQNYRRGTEASEERQS